MTQQLIPVFSGTINNQPAQLVDARVLHSFLGVGKLFAAWITKRIAQYGFVENQDFVFAFPDGKANQGRGGHNKKNYHLTLDMAKELAMVERTEKGRQARRYFIECERRLVAGDGAAPLPCAHPDPARRLPYLQFEDVEFDVVEFAGRPWLRMTEISLALGYRDPHGIKNAWGRNRDRFDTGMTALVELKAGPGAQQCRIFSLEGARLLAGFTRKQRSGRFCAWLDAVIGACGDDSSSGGSVAKCMAAGDALVRGDGAHGAPYGADGGALADGGARGAPGGSGGGAQGDGAHGAPYGSGGGTTRAWPEAHELPPTEGDAARLRALNSMIEAMGFERGQPVVVHYKELIDVVWLLRRLQEVMRLQHDYRPQIEERIARLKDVTGRGFVDDRAGAAAA